jgi:5,10-methylenetetrahydrofolate reductase
VTDGGPEIALQFTRPAPAVWLELSPPDGISMEPALQWMEQLRGIADAVNLTDNSMGRAKLSSLVFGLTIKQRTGIPLVLNMSCRDRNLLALRSDLMAAAATGIDAVVALKGDRLKPGAGANVHETGVIGLLREIAELGREARESGLRAPIAGVVANPHRAEIERELELLKRKAVAGARFAITQPVFVPESVIRFAGAVRSAGLAPIAGLLPIKSSAMARYMLENIPELSPVRSYLEPYLGLDKKSVRRLALTRSLEIMDSLRSHVAGFVIMSGGEPSLAVELLREWANRGRQCAPDAGSS